MASKQFVGLLVIVSVVGVVVSLATWCFLELIHEITQELYVHLPHAVGYGNGPPDWWSLPVLGIAGVIVALAITRLPGNGGHVPARGLAGGAPAGPDVLPGVLLAGLAGISFGIVLGPEAPLLALGPGLAVLMIRLVRPDTPPQALTLIGAAGAFAAVSFLFVSPLVAAVLMIEVTALGGARQTLLVVPGVLAAGIGSLLAIGLGSWTGLNRSAIALGPVPISPVRASHRRSIRMDDHAGVGGRGIMPGLLMQSGLLTYRFAKPRPLLVLPVIGLVVAGLAIAFSHATGKSVNEVLFSGESGLGGLIAQGPTWSMSALALLIVFKGVAYGLSLGSFRGGPTFPAVFLGAAAGLLASHLPGFPVTPAVAVGMGAATAAVLKLPLSAIVLATLLTSKGGTGDEPLIIVGVVVAYIVALLMSRMESAAATSEQPAAGPAGASRSGEGGDHTPAAPHPA